MDASFRSILFVDYTGPMGDRTHGVGVDAGASRDSAIDLWRTLIVPALTAWWDEEVQVTGFRWQAVGTDFSTPVSVIPPIAGLQTTAFTANEYPVQVSYSLRSPTTGTRSRIFLYGFGVVPPNDYRFELGNFALADDLLSAVQVACSNGLYVADDGSRTTPNLYTNIRYNSYWQRRYRALF